jgi:SAM-dependent methyltransferase
MEQRSMTQPSRSPQVRGEPERFRKPSPEGIAHQLSLPQNLFNGYLGAHVAFAYKELGLFELLRPHDRRTVEELVTQLGCSESRLRALLGVGIALGLLEVDGDHRYSFTVSGESLRQNIGLFTWAIGGYGQFLRELSKLTADRNAQWSQLIDGSMVALGSHQANEGLMQSIVHDVMSGLRFRRVADLGCGNAGRLIEVCQRHPGAEGIGLDISEKAIDLARRNVERHALAGRIALRRVNVLDVIDNAELASELGQIDLVMCFMMLHDLFNTQPAASVLLKLRRVFPGARSFIFADSFRMEPPASPHDLPIFTVGFELLHSFMGVKIHEPGDYIQAFRDAGMSLKQMRPLAVPNTYLFVLEVVK